MLPQWALQLVLFLDVQAMRKGLKPINRKVLVGATTLLCAWKLEGGGVVAERKIRIILLTGQMSGDLRLEDSKE